MTFSMVGINFSKTPIILHRHLLILFPWLANNRIQFLLTGFPVLTTINIFRLFRFICAVLLAGVLLPGLHLPLPHLHQHEVLPRPQGTRLWHLHGLLRTQFSYFADCQYFDHQSIEFRS